MVSTCLAAPVSSQSGSCFARQQSIVQRATIVSRAIRADPESGDNTASPAEDIERLIQQLGATDFAERNSAEEQLLRLGRRALPRLLWAVRSPNGYADNEIRMRAQRLIVEIQRIDFNERVSEFLAAPEGDESDFGFPGWQRFADIVGDGKRARQMFLSMYKSHPKLFLAINQSQAKFADQWRTASGNSMRTIGSTGRAVDSLCCLIFLMNYDFGPKPVGESRIQVERKFVTRLASQLLKLETRTYVNGCRHRVEIEKLLEHWLNQTVVDDLVWINQRLSIIEGYGLKTQCAFLLKQIIDRKQPLQIRSYALEILRQIGNPAIINELIPALRDETPVARAAGGENPRMVDVQFRDLVLATSIQLAGLELSQFGFSRTSPTNRRLDIQNSGFPDEVSRANAFKSWFAVLAKSPGFESLQFQDR